MTDWWLSFIYNVVEQSCCLVNDVAERWRVLQMMWNDDYVSLKIPLKMLWNGVIMMMSDGVVQVPEIATLADDVRPPVHAQHRGADASDSPTHLWPGQCRPSPYLQLEWGNDTVWPGSTGQTQQYTISACTQLRRKENQCCLSRQHCNFTLSIFYADNPPPPFFFSLSNKMSSIAMPLLDMSVCDCTDVNCLTPFMEMTVGL